MKFSLPKDKIKFNIREGLRHLSYFGLLIGGETSYVRRLSRIQHYPRFHLYLNETDNQITFNLHLDQKHASYEGSSAHSGEYDGETVKAEAERIISVLQES